MAALARDRRRWHHRRRPSLAQTQRDRGRPDHGQAGFDLARAALVGLALSTAANGVAAQTPPPYPPWPTHRWQEDWSFLRDPSRRGDPLDALKFVPLDPTGLRHATFGGELRERLESYQNRFFGLIGPRDAPRGNTYLLQRLLLHADLQLDPAFRAFVQFGTLAAFGERGGTLGATQRNDAALVQGFGELRLPLAGGALALRGGRQEIAFGSERLVSAREGPNLRRAFDGARATWTLGATRIDAFATRPVEPLRDRFDRSDPGEAFWGAHLETPLPLAAPARLRTSLAWFGYERNDATFAQGTAFERRHTLDARLVGTIGAVDLDWEAAYQTGTFGSARIDAWTVGTDTGVTLAGLPWRPRLGLKADIASGDADLRDGHLGTFNALYPKVPYFTEAGFVAPANLIDVYPSIRMRPAPPVSVELGWDVLWRHRTADAFYRPVPLGPLPRTAGQSDRFIGSQLNLTVLWALGRHLALRADYVHFFAGPTVTRAGGRDADFALASIAYRF